MADSFDEAATADAEPVDEMTWNDYTVIQLKEELSVRGLETTGKKADLVSRLEKYDNGVYLLQLSVQHYGAFRIHFIIRPIIIIIIRCFVTRCF